MTTPTTPGAPVNAVHDPDVMYRQLRMAILDAFESRRLWPGTRTSRDAASTAAGAATQLVTAAIAAERARLIGGDDAPGVLDRYKVGAFVLHQLVPGTDSARPVVVWLCNRPHLGSRTGEGSHLGVILRDLDGDQTDLTVGELAHEAIRHEAEAHTPTTNQH